jgi:hypothetical protein
MPRFRRWFDKVKRYLPKGRDWLMLAVGALLTLGTLGVINMMKTKESPPPLEPPKPLAKAAGITIPWLPDTVRRWEPQIDEMAKKYNIDPNLIAILVTLESGGYAGAVSEADAQGLMQITPPAAQDIAKKYLQEPRTDYDLKDPSTNIEFGTAYVAHLRDEFGDPTQSPSWDYTVELVAAAYNGGPGSAGMLFRGQGLPSQQAVSYSRDVMNMWRERNAETSPTFNRWLERGGQRLIDLARSKG